MPRQPARSYSDVFNRLKDEEISDENGILKKKLCKRASEGKQPWIIWAEGLELMNAHGLYIYVQGDRKGIQTALRKHQCSTTLSLVHQAECNISSKSSPPSSKNSSFDEMIQSLPDHSQDNELPAAPDECDILLRMRTGIAYSTWLQTIAINPLP